MARFSRGSPISYAATDCLWKGAAGSRVSFASVEAALCLPTPMAPNTAPTAPARFDKVNNRTRPGSPPLKRPAGLPDLFPRANDRVRGGEARGRRHEGKGGEG